MNNKLKNNNSKNEQDKWYRMKMIAVNFSFAPDFAVLYRSD